MDRHFVEERNAEKQNLSKSLSYIILWGKVGREVRISDVLLNQKSIVW